MLTKDSLEPGVLDTLKDVDIEYLDPAHAVGVALLSIAISQKRQADSMDRLEAQPSAANGFLAKMVENMGQ